MARTHDHDTFATFYLERSMLSPSSLLRPLLVSITSEKRIGTKSLNSKFTNRNFATKSWNPFMTKMFSTQNLSMIRDKFLPSLLEAQHFGL